MSEDCPRTQGQNIIINQTRESGYLTDAWSRLSPFWMEAGVSCMVGVRFKTPTHPYIYDALSPL